MQVKVCHWEHADLLEYLEDRNYEWETSDRSIFLKTSPDGDPQMALQIVSPLSTGPHRLYTVSSVSQLWAQDQSDAYLLRILEGWTGYGNRRAMEALLVEELKLDTMTAFAMSIALNRIIHNPAQPPEEAGMQEALFEGKVVFPPQPTDRMEKTWLVGGGGYVKLELRGGLLQTAISLPADDAWGGGFDHPLRGIVRPKFRTTRDAAESLFGWHRAVPEGLLGEQQKLQEVADGDNPTS